MREIWTPSVTVAAIIEREGRFLLVEEETSEGLRFNQPAGHLNRNESLEQAVIRETLEETAHDFSPQNLIGVYMSRHISSRNGDEITYLRFAFSGALGKTHDHSLDEGIVRIVWMDYEELRDCRQRHRSPLVLQCVEDFRAGCSAPLSLLNTHPSAVGIQNV